MIPVLVILTIVVLFQVTRPPTQPEQVATAPASNEPSMPAAASRPSVSRTQALVPEQSAPEPAAALPLPAAVPDLTNKDADGHLAASIAAGALPAGADFVAAGAGTFHVVPGTTPPHGTGQQVSTYTIEVEDGLLATVEDDQAFAAVVDASLADPRSWIGGGQFSLARIDTADPDFRITLTSQLTIRSGDRCGFDIPLEASCYNGWAGRVFINDARWTRGAMSYNGDLAGYRAYAVNHEVGHALGMRHEACPAQGAPAPVMMQQSWSTSDDDLSLLDPQTIPRDGNVCAANPYPFPGAAPVSPPAPEASTAAG